uniref:Pre-mRNA-splicing factor ISY1 n=1 Tax=Chromera velia CCMP2878 TaxID=1169474 RepID=A0A0G4FX75_9ALVE|eukprot:Cvel_19216.t1-p1 / transcript=Cvel_19216.t1 / gene=Cvel_19216 / organism=Chromera_velia_CCMP2878 / gene_product=Pre-mRNA-splicing factor ISY1 homolog, putative / transcript_product=Pre-mRNA-splicing factor ISY1 homolog, putative / location=Cvel_scaffold1641:23458-26933(-) / protein_length=280 / sequence_SO=supercontig / SO=protein_coding / is_pseudo=false
MAMLNRWDAMKKSILQPNRGRRPKLASECDVLDDAKFWRNQVVREMSRKIAEIQNAGLGESRIRDLNDEINKLLREKGHWERRIKELGGAEMKLPTGTQSAQLLGAELAGGDGYKYFGAAKDLPGVRELFANQEPAQQARRTRKELRKNLGPDYYGWRDEEDGLLLLAEQAKEMEQRDKAEKEWRETQSKRQREQGGGMEDIPSSSSAAATGREGGGEEENFRAYVAVPDRQAIEAIMLKKEKEKAMASLAVVEKYQSRGMQREEEDSLELVGKKRGRDD